MEEMAFQSAVELAALVRGKKISAREMLDYFLERVNRLNPELNAIVCMNVEDARKRAAAADHHAATGRALWEDLVAAERTVVRRAV